MGELRPPLICCRVAQGQRGCLSLPPVVRKAAHRVVNTRELSLPLISYGTLESRPYLGQHSTTDPGEPPECERMGELVPPLSCCEVLWVQGGDAHALPHLAPPDLWQSRELALMAKV